MTTYTAFCRESDYTGTTWISAVEANSIEEAIEVAQIECAGDWEVDESDVVCVGIASGNIKIEFWDDGE